MPPRTILVVADDPDTREFYEVLLQAAGYGVLRDHKRISSAFFTTPRLRSREQLRKL